MKYKIHKQKIINNNILLNVEFEQDLEPETAWVYLAHFLDLELRKHKKDVVKIIEEMRELEWEKYKIEEHEN